MGVVKGVARVGQLVGADGLTVLGRHEVVVVALATSVVEARTRLALLVEEVADGVVVTGPHLRWLRTRLSV